MKKLKVPRTPIRRKGPKRKYLKSAEDIRTSEGEIIDISPELGKKKGRKGRKFKPPPIGNYVFGIKLIEKER